MNDSTIRIGFTKRRGPREPSLTGRAYGVFHLGRVAKDRGRVLTVGYQTFERRDLELLADRAVRIDVRVYGVLHLGDDVTPSLVASAFERVAVSGRVIADDRVEAALPR